MTGSFAAAQAPAGHWGLAAKAGLAGLGPLAAGTNFGIVYVTEALADDLASIVTFLKETTSITDWLGAVGHEVFGPDAETGEKPALALMTGHLAKGAVRLFEGPDPLEPGTFAARHGAWLDRQRSAVALVHGDPQEPALEDMLTLLAGAGPVFVFGGLTVLAETPSQVAGTIRHGGLSGALFGDGVELLVGLSQGCHPIGPVHRVTEAVETVVMALDGQPALALLKAEAGEVIARDLKRAAGFIHVARPIEGSDEPDAYQVRSLIAIDPIRGWLAVGEKLEQGDRLLFVRRDANAAQQDMLRMLQGLAARLGGRAITGGVYISCVGRGAHMFGTETREREMIRETLGDFPLIGFAAPGEICRNGLYGFTGVLALFV